MVEHLPRKSEALNSSPSATKKKKEKESEKRREAQRLFR
jgi:hypothetical protein